MDVLTRALESGPREVHGHYVLEVGRELHFPSARSDANLLNVNDA